MSLFPAFNENHLEQISRILGEEVTGESQLTPVRPTEARFVSFVAKSLEVVA